MNKLSTPRFVVSAILMSLGWWSLLWIDLACLFFFAAWFVVTPREQLHQAVSPRELLWIMLILVAFIALAVASKIFVPESADRALERIMKNPVVIIPLWLLCLWLAYRNWRRRGHNAA